jgi:exopolysaccharide biosynthesis polyprenyl glycosylphosphotransferase
VAGIVRMFRGRVSAYAWRQVAFQQTEESLSVELGNTVTARPLPAPSTETSRRGVLRPLPEPAATPPPGPRHRSSRSTQRRAAGLRAALDLVSLIVAALAAVAFDSGSPLSRTALVTFVVVTLAILHATSIHGVRDRLRLEVLDDTRLIVSATAVAAMASQFVAALALGNEPSAYDAMRLWGFSAALLVATHAASIAIVHRRRRTELGGMRTLIVGAGQVGRLTAGRLAGAPELGLHPVGFLDKEPIDNGRPLPLPVLGASWDLEHVVSTYGIDCVVFTFSTAPHDVLLGLLDECDRLGIRALVVPRLFERVPSRVQLTHVGALPLLELMPTSTRSFQYALKYALDRLAALFLVLLLSPILIAVALAVLLSLGRPILYRQERVGRDGRHFEMLKFRTMLHATEAAPNEVEFDPETGPGGVEGSDRRTGVGSFLRRTSLDELAQLFNVLKGEMSLVGPRPERPEFVEFFGESVRRYDARHRVKSGITGWAQIHRLRGKTSISDRVEWDNYYIENFSLWLDLKILLRTIPEVVRGGTE